MFKKLIAVAMIILLVNASVGLAPQVFAQSPAVSYLCEIGKKYYNQGSTADALHEFNKALMIDPQNSVALDYVRKINQEGYTSPDIYTPDIHTQVSQYSPSRDEAINAALDRFSGNREPTAFQPATVQRTAAQQPTMIAQNSYYPPSIPVTASRPYVPPKKNAPQGEPWLKVSGEVDAAVGMNSQGETIWKRANYDLNEKNWRILSQDAFNNGVNTADPAIYDRLNVKLDTPKDKDGFGFHANISIDPWSFTGKTDKVTLTGAGGDSANVQLKYWSNTGYTVNSSVFTLKNGDTFNLPELKVKNGMTVPTTITTTWGNIFTIPAMKIHQEFMPLRELWFDYKSDDFIKIRVFPLATENQAYTSDDPLGLSNHHIYWEDSPWLRAWKPGNFNSGATPISFTKGYWDNSDSFFVKDSNGIRLTALRGFYINLNPTEKTSITTTWASPKDFWQEYGDFDNIEGASRIKYSANDKLNLGLTHTMRMGYVDDGTKIDSRNQVLGGDASYEFTEGTKLIGEVAGSQSSYDLTNDTYRSKKNGGAYFVSLVNRYPEKEIINTSYDSIRADKNESFMSKFRFLFARMDKGFDPTLSSYRQTREDSYWSRHIHFRQPFDYFYQGLYGAPMSIDDINAFAIGDGLDTDRQVYGFRWEGFWSDKFNNLFDIRNVHTTDGTYVETVARDEATWKINEQLTAKALGIYQHMPKTTAGKDPFIYDSVTGQYLDDFSADPIKGGLDASLKTGSLGLEYAFTDWLSVNGVYEITNDYTLAYGDFPRGDLSSAQPSNVFIENGNTYLSNRPFLYDQQFFPQPPYPFYDIYKAGILFLPVDKVQVYFDYTYNQFKKAGQISDEMNHVGAEIAYLPTKALGFYLRYTYSLWEDLDRVVAGDDKVTGHHNIFAAIRYMLSKDQEFDLEYGFSPNYPIVEGTTADPYGGGLQTIDTQHFIRLFYKQKF